MNLHLRFFIGLFCLFVFPITEANSQESMDKSWGKSVVKLRAENAERGQLFDEGNYAMFIHWGTLLITRQRSRWKDLLRHRRMDYESSDGWHSD